MAVIGDNSGKTANLHNAGGEAAGQNGGAGFWGAYMRACLWVFAICTLLVVNNLSRADFAHYLDAHNVGIAEGVLRVIRAEHYDIFGFSYYVPFVLFCAGLPVHFFFKRLAKPDYDFDAFLGKMRAFGRPVLLVVSVWIAIQQSPFGFDRTAVAGVFTALLFVWIILAHFIKKINKRAANDK